MYIVVNLENCFFNLNINWYIFKKIFTLDPFFCLKISFYYIFFQKAYAKSLLVPYFDAINIDPLVNKRVLDFLMLQDNERVLLITSANEKIAEKIVRKYNVFQHFIASTKQENLISDLKQLKLEQFLNGQDFFYLTSYFGDIEIIRIAQKVGLVNPNEELVSAVKFLNKEYLEI